MFVSDLSDPFTVAFLRDCHLAGNVDVLSTKIEKWSLMLFEHVRYHCCCSIFLITLLLSHVPVPTALANAAYVKWWKYIWSKVRNFKTKIVTIFSSPDACCFTKYDSLPKTLLISLQAIRVEGQKSCQERPVWVDTLHQALRLGHYCNWLSVRHSVLYTGIVHTSQWDIDPISLTLQWKSFLQTRGAIHWHYRAKPGLGLRSGPNFSDLNFISNKWRLTQVFYLWTLTKYWYIIYFINFCKKPLSL